MSGWNHDWSQNKQKLTNQTLLASVAKVKDMNRSKKPFDYNEDFSNRRNDLGRSGKHNDEWAYMDKITDVDYGKVKDKIAVKKDFYRETARTARRVPEEIRQWRDEKQIHIDDPHCMIKPIMDFSELDVPSALTDMFRKNGYQTPTPIQAQSWPVSLRGQDTVGIARTGSGKTLSFLVPALVHIRAQHPLRRGDGPIALVLVPTRELAQQVLDESQKFGTSMAIRATACYGGAPKMPQRRDLEAGAELVVACPGRLLDFIHSKTTNMFRCSFLIMDEADRMLDMGFEQQIRKILGQCRKERQTLMYSATWPKEVRRLAEDFLVTPSMITVGSSSDQLMANPKIKQLVDVVDEWDKPVRFTRFMDKAYSSGKIVKTIVFTETKKNCDFLAQELGKRGWPVAPIHGDKDQRQRDSVLRDFRGGRIPILIATDVAARGLDISDVEYVINYDFPSTIEDYVHRIGRTARGDKSGISYTLVSKSGTHNIKQLIEVMQAAKQEIPRQLMDLQNSNRNMAGAKARSRRLLFTAQVGGNRYAPPPTLDGAADYAETGRLTHRPPPGVRAAGASRPKHGSLSRRFNPY